MENKNVFTEEELTLISNIPSKWKSLKARTNFLKEKISSLKSKNDIDKLSFSEKCELEEMTEEITRYFEALQNPEKLNKKFIDTRCLAAIPDLVISGWEFNNLLVDQFGKQWNETLDGPSYAVLKRPVKCWLNEVNIRLQTTC
jgi:hypothetical protein